MNFFFLLLCHIPSVCAFRVFWVHSLIMRLWGAVATKSEDHSNIFFLCLFSFPLEKKKGWGFLVTYWREFQWNDIRNRGFDFLEIVLTAISRFPKPHHWDVKMTRFLWRRRVEFELLFSLLFCGLMFLGIAKVSDLFLYSIFLSLYSQHILIVYKCIIFIFLQTNVIK